MMTPRDVTISLINHCNPQLLRGCLESLSDQKQSGCSVQVYVVDNAASDPSTLEALRSEFPHVRWILNDRTFGFSHNHNQVLSRFLADPESGRHICLLNDDTIVHPGSVARLVDFLDSHPDVGLVGPRLFNADGTLQNSAFKDVTVSLLFIGSTLLPRSLMGLKMRGVAEAVQRASVPADADWLLGACLVARRSALAAVGPLDAVLSPRANCEEIDWCMRFRREGWQVVYVPDAGVTHLGGQSLRTDKDAAQAQLSIETARLMLGLVYKHRGLSTAIAVRAAMAVAGCWNTLMLIQGRVRGRLSDDAIRAQASLNRNFIYGLPLWNASYTPLPRSKSRPSTTRQRRNCDSPQGVPSVLIVPDRAFLGGVCRVVSHLWSNLPRLEVNAAVLFSSDDVGTKETIAEWFSDDLRRVIVCDLGCGHLIHRLRVAIRAFRRTPAQVLNLHFNTLEGTSLMSVVAGKLAGKRVILTFHHLDAECGQLFRRRLAIRTALRLSTSVIVSTPLLSERVRKLRPSTQIDIVPLGVEIPNKKYDRDILRKQFAIPESAFVVGHISRLLSGKGLPKVVRAMRDLRTRCPDAWLLACGTPDRDTRSLTELMQNDLPDRSRMLGFVANHQEVIACCDLVAVPSGWEGFGLVYVEAAMHHLPRIGTRMGGVPFVIQDGVDGFLIEPDDIDALADRIARLYENPTLREEMGQNAYSRAMAEFTAEQMASNYKRVLGLAK